MNITNRLFTYPVLSEDKDDYISSKFNVTYAYKNNGINSIQLNFDIFMNNDEIDNMIRNGDAEYAIHLECSSTAYREVITTMSSKVSYQIPINKVNGNLEILALIVLKNKMKNYSSTDFIEDFKDISFELSKGNIIGYQNLPTLEIIKDYEELSNASSIFMIFKRLTDEEKPIEVNLDSSYIKIGLGIKEFEIYSRFCNNTMFQPILNSMLILPALIYVFEDLKQEDGIETHSGKSWYISLDKAYEKRGVSFLKEVLNTEKSSVVLAQEAMELPLNKALHMMSEVYDIGEDY